MAFFDHFAAGRSTRLGDWLTARTIDVQYRFFEGAVGARHDAEILEVGPGNGEFASRIMSAGFRKYDIVEPNPTLNARLRARGVRSAKSYFIPGLEEADGSYDAIIVCDVFEHLNDAREAQRFIAEAARVLRPGGHLLIYSPDFMDWQEDFYNCDFSHSNPTTVRRTHELFMNEGLRTVRFDYSHSAFGGLFGAALGKAVKAATCWASGEDLDFKPYKLRLTFLRRFMIAGRKEG